MMENYDDILNHTPDTDPVSVQPSKEDYAARKKEERDKVYELADNTALVIAGDGGSFQKYLDVQSTFDRYSVVNAMLITAQKPNATRIGDFEYWKSKDSFVKPGQSAISILEPHEYTKEDGTSGTGYNVKKVFDISQVDRIKTAPAPSYTDRQLLSALVSKAPMKISVTDKLPDELGAVTNPETGEILVRRGMAFADNFRSVAQELGYYEADADAAKIPVNPSFVGYCAGYMLCKKYGVDTQYFNFSAAPDVFRDLNERGIKQELTIIRDAVNTISGRMARNPEAIKGKETKVRDEAR